MPDLFDAIRAAGQEYVDSYLPELKVRWVVHVSCGASRSKALCELVLGAVYAVFGRWEGGGRTPSPANAPPPPSIHLPPTHILHRPP
jgi:hypothetical protein